MKTPLCPQRRTPMPARALAGLCAASSDTALVPPTVEELSPFFPALKILPSAIARDPAFSERFTREARALAKLNHPGLADISHASPDHAYDREWGFSCWNRCSNGCGPRLVRWATRSASTCSKISSARPPAKLPSRKRHRAGRRPPPTQTLPPEVLREEIAPTLADPSLVDEELRSRFAAFRQPTASAGNHTLPS